MKPQPIETAPKEPTNLLLVFDGDWYVGWWNAKGFWATYGNDGWVAITPTHWLPLPPRPEE